MRSFWMLDSIFKSLISIIETYFKVFGGFLRTWLTASNCWLLLQKCYVLDVWQGLKYASAIISINITASVFGVILVHIFPAFSRIRNEFGELRSISLYSVRMRENPEKIRTRITPNTNTFYAVYINGRVGTKFHFSKQRK